MGTYRSGRLRERLNRGVREHVFPGAAMAVVSASEEPLFVCAGRYTYDDCSPATTANSIFDVASVTKSIPTALCALHGLEVGWFTRATRVRDILPDLTGLHTEALNVHHLLSQTVLWNMGKLSELKNKPPSQIIRTILSTGLREPAGSSFWYSNATSILLGLCIEAVSGKRLDSLANEFLFGPLGMNHTSFHPETFLRDAIVPTEQDAWRGRLLQGEIHDESAWALRPDIIAGSAGLFSTVANLARVLQMLLKRGRYENKIFFTPETVAAMYANQLASLGLWGALGWELNQPWYMGSQSTRTTFGKTGFTGCCIVLDIERSVGFVLLSNYVHPHRRTVQKDSPINIVRREIADIVWDGGA